MLREREKVCMGVHAHALVLALHGDGGVQRVMVMIICFFIKHFLLLKYSVFDQNDRS